MAVNIPGNTVLGAPYWQRRNLRERGELENQLLEQKVEAFPREQAREDAMLGIRRMNANTAAETLARNLKQDQIDALAAASSAGLEYLERNPDDPVGATDTWLSAAQANGLDTSAFQPDRVIDPEEMRAMVAARDYEMKDTEFVGFVNPDDPSDEIWVRRNSPQADRYAEEGYRQIRPVQRQETGAPGDFDPRTESQRGSAHQANLDEYNTSSDVQELISATLPGVMEKPGTVGARGKFAVGTAGVLSTLGQQELGEAAAKAIAGEDVETIAQMQTQLQVIRGRIIPLVTGEQGKRLSEMEREIASRAVGLIDQIQGPADLAKSYPQVIGAMRQLYVESWARKFMLASQDPNIAYPYNMKDVEDVTEFVAESLQAGIDQATIRQAITRLQMIQERNE